MPIDPPAREDTYIIDPESGVEMVRLIVQGSLVSKRTGLFPPDVDPTALPRVLELACGPGNWAVDAAFAYPEMELIGVDISQTMIQYARAQAWSQRLQNVSFRVMNILKPLDFENDTFHFVNACFLTGFMSPEDWPGLLQECKRVLHPGGTLRLLEAEDFGITNSPAIEHFTQLIIAAERKLGRAFFAVGRFAGTMAMLAPLLRRSGFQDVHQQSYIIDWSADAADHQALSENIKAVLPLLKPFLLNADVISAEGFEELNQQALVEMNAPDFVAIMLSLSTWGKANK